MSTRTTFAIAAAHPRGRGKLWGFIDASGRVVAKPQFDEVLEDSEGRVAVSVKGRWGYADTSGTMVVAPKWLAAAPFSEGLAPVVLESKEAGESMEDRVTIHKCGYIDRSGKSVIDPQWVHDCGPFRDGRARWLPFDPAAHTKREGGFLDKTGALVVSNVRGYYGALASFRSPGPSDYAEGFALVSNPNRLLDVMGKELKPPSGWEPVSGFSAGLAELRNASRDGVVGFMKTTGDLAFTVEAHDVSGFHDGRAVLANKPNGPFGYIDACGVTVIEPSWRKAGDFWGGYAVVGDGEGDLVIDRAGKTVTRLEFSAARDARGGLIRLLVEPRTISSAPPPLEAYVTALGKYVYVSDGIAEKLGAEWVKARMSGASP